MDKSVMLPQKGGWVVLDDRNMSGERRVRNTKRRYKRKNGRFEHPVGRKDWKG